MQTLGQRLQSDNFADGRNQRSSSLLVALHH